MNPYPLHQAVLAVDYELASELIRSNVNLDQWDELGNTPLHWAMFVGDIDLAKLLLESGANPNVLSRDGVTPRWRAKDFGLTDIDDLLEHFNGKVLTNENFNRAAFTAFNTMIGQPLPKEDNDCPSVKRKKWWQFWTIIKI